MAPGSIFKDKQVEQVLTAVMYNFILKVNCDEVLFHNMEVTNFII